MNPEELLRATRDVYLLVRKPGSQKDQNWAMRLTGLHQVHIKGSVKALRQDRQGHGETVSQDALKPKALQNGVAIALGTGSHDDWVTSGQQSLIQFFQDNGLSRPVDLITWREGTPGLSNKLTAQRVADRFFNSGLPLPRKLFTGVGSLMFAANEYGTLDMSELIVKERRSRIPGIEKYIAYGERHAQEVVLRAYLTGREGVDTPEFLDLTGHQLLLLALSELVGTMYNLIGDNLVEPHTGVPVFRQYNTLAHEIALNNRLYAVFRAEMERTTQGWVEVIPMPGSDNIVFLKGADGAFDWVVRDQRDEDFTENPFYPMLKQKELPTAMQSAEALETHLYFSRGNWRERLEHEAEDRYYREGGLAGTWPGYKKLVQRELAASRNYSAPSQPSGGRAPDFIPHRLNDRCLMVSQLVTIEEFWRFYGTSAWRVNRESRTAKPCSHLDNDLTPMNLSDPGHLPASVTYFDAVAYCRAYEDRTGLPVRLLNIEEWQQVSQATGVVEKEIAPRAPRAITGVWPAPLRYVPELTWLTNAQGAKFLYAWDFGEWLLDYQSGLVPAACAATGVSLRTGSLERAVFPAGNTMRYKSLKVGFRMCYVSQFDA